MKKKDSQNKEVSKTVRYSAEEWKELESKLNLTDLNYSAFIRKVANRAKITPVNMEAIRELRDARTDLARIGNNINTIARHAGLVIDKTSFDVFLDDLRRCRDEAKELSDTLDKVRRAIR